MTEHWFYHLENAAIEGVLPMLLEKSLERGWTCLVKTSDDKIGYFDEFLWTYRADSFLPHGRDDEPLSEYNPITLTASSPSANGADIVLIEDGSDVEDLAGVTRCIFMIDGKKSEAVQEARIRWSRLKDTGETLSYYQQDERGRWAKKA